MRYRGRLAVFGAVLCIASLACIVTAQFTAAAPPATGVHVAIAVPEGYRTLQSPLYIVIANTSDQPQRHFEEWNSWGYGNIEIAWQAEDGRTGIARKVPGSWDRNVPTSVTLQPGETLVRQVTFDPTLWNGWPDLPHGTTWTLTATYRSVDDQNAGAWVGTASSATRAVLIR